jgi:hypothetical protein
MVMSVQIVGRPAGEDLERKYRSRQKESPVCLIEAVLVFPRNLRLSASLKK